MSRRSLLSVCFVFLLVRAALAAPAEPAAATPAVSPPDLEFFETKIRPLLVERCYKCHSHAEGKDKGGLYVDSRSALLAGGDNGPSVVPGEPAKSKLIEAVGYGNVDLQMPPKGKLSDAQIADLTEWVKRGAPWPGEQGAAGGDKPVARAAEFDIAKRKAEHWAWQPVRPSPPPAVKDAGWPKSDVDRFILAKLEEKNLRPAGRADRRTLIRRASFAITGLPPTPEEVEAFVAEESPDAFAKVVDRLLASPRFGERWGRHWLDLVRYAESRGHEFDHDAPNAWRYRDYVIRAFNADVPYDQFVIEHIAGDLLEEPRTGAGGAVNESVLGTGFWFLGEWVHSPVDIRQDETERVDNQIDVMGKTFLGLTIGCARCHDHKFDAISDEDYYALAGFLHSSSYRDAAFENESHNRAVVAKLAEHDAKIRAELLREMQSATEPTVDRLEAYLLAAGAKRRGAKTATPDDLDPAVVEAWAAELSAARKDARHPLHPLALAATMTPADAEQRLPSLLAGVAARWSPAEPQDAPASRVVDYGDLQPGQWIADGFGFGERPPAAMTIVPGTSADQPIARVYDGGTAHSAAAGGNLPGMLRTPTFVITKPMLSMLVSGNGTAFICIDSHRMVAGPLHGVSRQQVKAGDAWRVQTANLSQYIGHRAHVEFRAEDNSTIAVRWVKLADAAVKPPAINAAVADLLTDPATSYADLASRYAGRLKEAWSDLTANANRGADKAASRKPILAERAQLADWLARRPTLVGYSPARHTKVRELVASSATERAKIAGAFKQSATAMAMLDGSPFDERLLIRGLHKTPGDVIPRRFLEAIDGPASMQIDRGSGRLQLAQKIASPANPLTSRVIVNRVWHHLFGRGIVASTDNFGVLGDVPTHPELLDHLAAEFVRDGWSVKRLIRRLMLSETWQMSSRPTDPSAEEIDPQNLLLHRANLRRLEAEAIRDQMLFVSGRLDESMFGPSVPVHLTDFMEGRGRPGQSGPLDGAGRRSIYTQIRRNFLPPMLLAFDMPQPFNTMGRRAVSNVPAQALILMNDPFVVQQAEVWARRVLADGSLKTPEQRIDQMYRTAYARPPTADELSAAVAFLDQQGAERQIAPDRRRDDVRVWADLGHVLMNVKEFVYVP